MKYSHHKAMLAIAAAALALALGGSAAPWPRTRRPGAARTRRRSRCSTASAATAGVWSRPRRARRKPRNARASPSTNMPTARATRRRRSPTSTAWPPRGIDALVVFGDAGPAVLPALTNAYRAGSDRRALPRQRRRRGRQQLHQVHRLVLHRGRRELGQLDQEHPARRRQPAVPQRAGRQQPGPRRARRA